MVYAGRLLIRAGLARQPLIYAERGRLPLSAAAVVYLHLGLGLVMVHGEEAMLLVRRITTPERFI